MAYRTLSRTTCAPLYGAILVGSDFHTTVAQRVCNQQSRLNLDSYRWFDGELSLRVDGKFVRLYGPLLGFRSISEF